VLLVFGDCFHPRSFSAFGTLLPVRLYSLDIHVVPL